MNIMFNYCPPKQLQDLQSETFPDGKRPISRVPGASGMPGGGRP